MNTVLLKGKGINAALLFAELRNIYPEAVWSYAKLRFWQSQVRHELRIQNLTAEEIDDIKNALEQYWLLEIELEIF